MNIIKLKNEKKAVKFNFNNQTLKGLVIETFIGLSGQTTYKVETKKGIFNVEASVTEEIPMVSVFYEQGYRWSVSINNEEESRGTNLTKKEAIELAKYILDIEFNGDAVIDEQKLTKKQRAENIKHLHQTTETYHQHWRY